MPSTMVAIFTGETERVVVPGMAVSHGKEAPAMLQGALANIADMISSHVEVMVVCGYIREMIYGSIMTPQCFAVACQR